MRLKGWLALGFGVDDGALIEAHAYPLQPFLSAGRDIEEHPTMRGVPGVNDGRLITHAGIYDAAEMGNCLASFGLLPLWIRAPADYPAMAYRIDYDLSVQLAHNVTAYGSPGMVANLVIGRGKGFGAVNGQLMLAGCQLIVVGGQLIARDGYVAKHSAAA
jgi:hypothetical protein